MNRRNFLRTTTAATLALSQTGSLFALEADNAFRKAIGIQLYTLRNELGRDIPGTLKLVAEAGFKQVELYGFPNVDAMVAGAKDAGLKVNSTHFDAGSVVNPSDAEFSDFAKLVEKAEKVGLSHLVIPSIPVSGKTTLEDYKKIAGNANKAAAIAKKAGIQLSYHNHNFEFDPKEGGKTGYDIFAEEFSPDMKFEIDVFWVKAAGLDPVALIKKLSGRVSQLHLKNLKEGIATPTYSTGLPKEAFQDLGHGVINIEEIIVAAKAAGVEHCHVEQDQSPDALASIRESIAYLGKL